MKKILTTLLIGTLFLLTSYGQEKEDKLKVLEKLEKQTVRTTPPDTLVLDKEDVMAIEEPDTLAIEEGDFAIENEAYDNDTSTLRIGKNIIIMESDDSVTIRVGQKEVVINEDGNNTTIDINNYRKERGSRQFQGHLGGIELGFNNYLTEFWSSSLDPEDNYLDLNTAKSSCFNIISPNVSLSIARRFGIVAALGVNFNNYRFDGNNSIEVNEGGVIIPSYPPFGVNFEKSKLATVYAILPVLLEAQIPVSRGSSINIGAGVIGAVKLGSHTKVVYFDDGKQKEKNKDDFNLNLLRYGVTGRLGYEMVQVYGTCYLSPLFEKRKGPELYPFEVGIALTIND